MQSQGLLRIIFWIFNMFIALYANWLREKKDAVINTTKVLFITAAVLFILHRSLI